MSHMFVPLEISLQSENTSRLDRTIGTKRTTHMKPSTHNDKTKWKSEIQIKYRETLRTAQIEYQGITD
jgi:hypothetical protein